MMTQVDIPGCSPTETLPDLLSLRALLVHHKIGTTAQETVAEASRSGVRSESKHKNEKWTTKTTKETHQADKSLVHCVWSRALSTHVL